jgi:hypothetical protein
VSTVCNTVMHQLDSRQAVGSLPTRLAPYPFSRSDIGSYICGEEGRISPQIFAPSQDYRHKEQHGEKSHLFHNCRTRLVVKHASLLLSFVLADWLIILMRDILTTFIDGTQPIYAPSSFLLECDWLERDLEIAAREETAADTVACSLFLRFGWSKLVLFRGTRDPIQISREQNLQNEVTHSLTLSLSLSPLSLS